MSIAAPFDRYRGEVRTEWIDLNGHMNLAYYTVLFDYATDLLFDTIGIGKEYKRATNHGTFVAESHNLYEHELLVDERVRITRSVKSLAPTVSVCIWRTKCSALHLQAQRVATQELMFLSVDLGHAQSCAVSRRSADAS